MSSAMQSMVNESPYNIIARSHENCDLAKKGGKSMIVPDLL